MRSLAKLQEAPALILALLGLCLGATIASAQVPHDMNYQGRLVDAVGAPLTGTVDFEIRIHEFIDLGFALYEEHHAAVALDDDGGFNVRIGTGTPITGKNQPRPHDRGGRAWRGPPFPLSILETWAISYPRNASALSDVLPSRFSLNTYKIGYLEWSCIDVLCFRCSLPCYTALKKNVQKDTQWHS